MRCQIGSCSLASTLTLMTLALLLLPLLFREEKFRRQVSPSAPPKLERCQLNGVLSSTGNCVCDSGWGGAECGTLQLQPVDPLKQGLRAHGVSSWVPAPIQGPLVLGAALIATLARSRQLKESSKSIVNSIAHVLERDEQFRSIFQSHADTIRSIQTPGARRIVDRTQSKRASRSIIE